MLYTYTGYRRGMISRYYIAIVFFCLSLLAMISACKKDTVEDNPAVVQVFNALDGQVNLFTDLSDSRPEVFGSSLMIEGKYFNRFLGTAYPQPLQFYSTSDTMAEHGPVLNTTLDIRKGELYSIFIHGQKSAVSYSLFHDRFPVLNRKDSSINIRLANFSSIQDISVNLKGETPGSFIESIPARSVGDFIEMPFRKTAGHHYDFEIRDKNTGALIATQTITTNTWDEMIATWVFRFNTLVLTGHEGAAAPDHLQITVMPNR